MFMRIFSRCSPQLFKLRGFTLIELLLIIFIIGIFSTFLTLRLEGFFSLGGLEQAAKMIANDIKILQSKATYTKVEQKIVFDMDQESYNIFIKNSSNQNNANSMKEMLIDPVITKILPKGIDLAGIKIPPDDIKNTGSVEIRFYSNGSAQEAMLHLKNEKGEKITLKINSHDGSVIIQDAHVEKTNK